MGQALKNNERIRPVINRQDLKAYAKLETGNRSRFAPFHRKWTYRDFVQILRAEGMMAQSYVRTTNDILHKDEVVGFVLYKLEEDHFEILNLVTESERPDVLGKLLSLVQSKAGRPSSPRKFITFTVRETDENWHMALSAAGFQAELVRDYFDHPVEDGYRFKWESEHVSEPE